MAIKLTLPFPPTVNTYWRHVACGLESHEGKPSRAQVRALLSKRGRQYKQVATLMARRQFAGRAKILDNVEVSILLFPPDARRRDLDNYPKALFDSLTGARVWADDSLVKDLRMRWGGKSGSPRAEIEITPIVGAAQCALLP